MEDDTATPQRQHVVRHGRQIGLAPIGIHSDQVPAPVREAYFVKSRAW